MKQTVNEFIFQLFVAYSLLKFIFKKRKCNLLNKSGSLIFLEFHKIIWITKFHHCNVLNYTGKINLIVGICAMEQDKYFR